MNNPGCWGIHIAYINEWGPDLGAVLPITFPSREKAEDYRSNDLQDPAGIIYEIHFVPA